MKKIKINFRIVNNQKIQTFRLNVMLHGLLMEIIPPSYAELLHSLPVNPYSQSVKLEGDLYIWQINLLDEDAESLIGQALLDDEFSQFNLRSLNEGLCRIESKTTEELSQKQLTDIFYEDKTVSKIRLHFNTPTAFKQQGEYVFVPDVRLIFQSLLMKHSQLIDHREEINVELLEEMIQSSRISSYRLNSYYYQIHGIKIPAFMGSITLDVRAAQSLINFMLVLFRFGEYSGVGIKTSMGMGSLTLGQLR